MSVYSLTEKWMSTNYRYLTEKLQQIILFDRIFQQIILQKNVSKLYLWKPSNPTRKMSVNYMPFCKFSNYWEAKLNWFREDFYHDLPKKLNQQTDRRLVKRSISLWLGHLLQALRYLIDVWDNDGSLIASNFLQSQKAYNCQKAQIKTNTSLGKESKSGNSE